MGRRDRKRKERIRSGLEAPIARRIGRTQYEPEEWDDLEDFDEIPPVSYFRRFLDGEGIPYQIRGGLARPILTSGMKGLFSTPARVMKRRNL